MLLLGFLIVLVLAMQIDLAADQKLRVAAGVLWLAVFLSGVLSLERCFAAEREHGCWRALRLYPVSPGVIFFAKATIQFVSLMCVEMVVFPAMTVFSGAPLLEQPAALVLVSVLANLGFASLGVVMSGLTAGMHQRGNLLALLLLPLMMPLMIGAAEATRLGALGQFDDSWRRWVQLLAVFAVLYSTTGALAFEHVLED
jgi:heme exporter protein B